MPYKESVHADALISIANEIVKLREFLEQVDQFETHYVLTHHERNGLMKLRGSIINTLDSHTRQILEIARKLRFVPEPLERMPKRADPEILPF